MRVLRRATSVSVVLVVAVATTLASGGAAPAGAAAPAVNWPQFRFDDNHTGLNPLETRLTTRNVRNLEVSWQAQLGSLVDASSPAVVDGVVFLASSDGRLWAYPADGC